MGYVIESLLEGKKVTLKRMRITGHQTIDVKKVIESCLQNLKEKLFIIHIPVSRKKSQPVRRAK